MTSPIQFYLASQSPRRKTLLTQCGYTFDTMNPAVDETPYKEESPQAYVARMALAKAHAGWHHAQHQESIAVLGADTTVAIGHTILGKPDNEAACVEMLSLLSGQWHDVLTAVALVLEQKSEYVMTVTRVKMREFSQAEIIAYWKTGEPADKAGAYAIQGLGAGFVEQIEGSYTGVVGLPLCETQALLKSWGIESQLG